jgi:hypothetical protein
MQNVVDLLDLFPQQAVARLFAAFNDAVSSSGYIALDDSLNNERKGDR